MWRFDFAFPDLKIAIEIQGYGKGHASYMSMASDYERHNEATRLGWSVYYYMGCHIEKDAIHETIAYLLKLLNTESPQKETGADLLRRLYRGKTS